MHLNDNSSPSPLDSFNKVEILKLWLWFQKRLSEVTLYHQMNSAGHPIKARWEFSHVSNGTGRWCLFINTLAGIRNMNWLVQPRRIKHCCTLIPSSPMSHLNGLVWLSNRIINLLFLSQYPHVLSPGYLYISVCVHHLVYSSHIFNLFFCLIITSVWGFIKSSWYAYFLRFVLLLILTPVWVDDCMK